MEGSGGDALADAWVDGASVTCATCFRVVLAESCHERVSSALMPEDYIIVVEMSTSFSTRRSLNKIDSHLLYACC